MNTTTHLAGSSDLTAKVARVFQKRTELAQEHFHDRMKRAWERNMAIRPRPALNPWQFAASWCDYWVDYAQRLVLFWDALRERGNVSVEHARRGLPPVLHFDYDMVLDGRTLERPVNYALVRIVPSEGDTVDPKSRPYIIIDPRAGHGPGIGGFKDDSQVGVALRAGHPVYFLIFFRDPEPGQTLIDVCAAERHFVHEVRKRHPDSPKPVIVGNCQGGWAAMMLAATNPEETGPIVLNGAPMSYWAGAWQDGPGDNPMRYGGGMLGGTWLSSFLADLGNGVFDGAWLVQNFESLNPANTYWDKYYHLFANADTEPPRFIDFERWWGGYYLMNREEIEWITRNLFVGNKLWRGGMPAGEAPDLRNIREPIVLFASMGDNITPPQQAFNWVADVYRSTEEIKARGQVIVGLLHQKIGHLGIFVSGKVARKEQTQIVSVLQSIEMLPPGLYAMEIHERAGASGKVEYAVEFTERRLEEIAARLNRFERADEKAFEVVAKLSEFNQLAYELFAQPLVRWMSNDVTAQLLRQFHPLRLQRWAFSDLNPWLAWLGPAARAVKAQRHPIPSDALGRRVEGMVSEAISASLDYYRAVRDAMIEAQFFLTYGNLYRQYGSGHGKVDERDTVSTEARDLPFVRDALSSIAQGGYTEALARVGALLARQGESLPLERLARKRDLANEYSDLLPDINPEQWRLIRGEQDIVVHYEPEHAVATLPQLLRDPTDRERLLKLARQLLSDERMRSSKPSPGQLALLDRLRDLLQASPPARSTARGNGKKGDARHEAGT
jgi:pimeloyl-ACP methyl ester carboxylesterase